VLSGNVSRMVVSGTSVAVDVLIQPSFLPNGTLYSKAMDNAGVFQQPVVVTPRGDGSYKLSLQTSSAVAPGHFAGNVTLSLCADSACNVPQQSPSFLLPYDINVLASTSAWLGDRLTALSAWPDVQDWETFQGNAAHTGYVPAEVNPNQFSTRWKLGAVPGSGSDYNLLNTLTTAKGQFFLTANNVLTARTEFDGTVTWKYDFSSLPYPSANPPAVANGVVYIAAGQKSSTFMFSFDALDGTLRSKSPMSSQWEYYLAPTIGAEGVYTNAGTYGGLYAFDRLGQQLYSQANLGQISMWTPAVDANGVYAYTGGKLTVVDPKTGVILSSITDPSFQNFLYEIGGAPVLGAPGSIFVANYLNSILNGGAIGNTLINFSMSKGAIAWQVPGDYPSTPAYAAGVLYVANEKPLRLEVRSETDGALLWSWIPPHSGDVKFQSEVLLTKNLVFVSTNLSTYAIDVNTHRTVWSYPQSGRLALSQNGILYIQGSALLTAINLK
jgi:PQQ-like domain